MKLALVMGTRPELIKMSPIIRECERLKLDFFILHTGQHYSYNLDKIFFDQLDLPKPRYNLRVGSGTYAEEVSQMLLGIEKVLLDDKVDIVLVEGDTNSCLAGALASSKCRIPVGHLEAGLRSYFSGMPEEINRVVVDHISNYLFAPTEKSKQLLLSEGIPSERIFVTGNTIVDAVQQNIKKSRWTNQLPFALRDFFLVTLHRQENVDNKDRFTSILKGIEMVSQELCLPVYYSIHPRASKKLKEFGIKTKGIEFFEPVDYFSFLWLEQHAKLIMTDSGGVQEEALILGTPCVTLRDNTERPETVEVGANILAGADSNKILECAQTMMREEWHWANPFGDGHSAERIMEIVRRQSED